MEIFYEKLSKEWADITISMRTEEIDILIQALNYLKSGYTDHFHISKSEYRDDDIVGDISFCLDNEAGNQFTIL